MKTLTILTAALIGAVAFPSLTMAKTVLGCDTYINSTGERNKVDPTCHFDVIGNNHAEKLIDPDGVANSGDEYTVADDEKQD